MAFWYGETVSASETITDLALKLPINNQLFFKDLNQSYPFSFQVREEKSIP